MTLEPPPQLSDFAFRLGFVMAAIMPSARHGEIRTYMLAKGVSEAELDAFYEAAIKVADGFYK